MTDINVYEKPNIGLWLIEACSVLSAGWKYVYNVYGSMQSMKRNNM